MNITYMSQALAEASNFRIDDAVISITEPGRRANLNLADPLSVIRLEFDDHDPNDKTNELMSEGYYDDQILFTEEQAQKIIKFVEENSQAKNLYVHCWAGISRSRAVVMALREHFGMDMNPISQWESANKHVYRIMQETLSGHKLGSCFGEIENAG